MKKQNKGQQLSQQPVTTNISKKANETTVEAKPAYEKRNVGIQTVQETKYYVSPQILSHHQLEKFDYNQFFYTPRTLSTLLFALLVMNFFAYAIVPIH